MEIGQFTNKNHDLGALLYNDSTSYENFTDEQVLEKVQQNANKFYQIMFDYRKRMPERGVLEFETPFFTIDLPRIEERIPRVVPPAKEKPLTKWEKFRKEKGMAPRQRRDKKVFDPISKRWVRRFGHKSIKKLEEARTAIIEVRPGEDHIDPFEKMHLQKKLMLEKEKQKALQNQMRAAGVDMKLLREKKSLYDTQPSTRGKKVPKPKREVKADRKDKELLQNTLKNAQISTGSMGIYDKKATKDEKDVKRKKKKNVNLTPNEEKERSLKMLKIMKRKDEIKDGVVNDDVLMRKR
jgi:regulator of ribosome biosynthesis